ncbi:MAG: hypothetical protein JWO38_3659 [Gemmataceae bacterium]|nr:hypothetical protein [Gemmataceae bacterium]
MPTPSKEYADEVLIRRLAYGDTIPDAARVAHVSERTVFRRLNNPTFRDRLSATQAAALSPGYGMLTTGLTDACYKLTQLVRHPNPHVGFKAAKAVVDLTLKMRDQVELEDRVTALERITKHKARFGEYPPPPEDDPDEDDPGPGDGPEAGRPPDHPTNQEPAVGGPPPPSGGPGPGGPRTPPAPGAEPGVGRRAPEEEKPALGLPNTDKSCHDRIPGPGSVGERSERARAAVTPTDRRTDRATGSRPGGPAPATQEEKTDPSRSPPHLPPGAPLPLVPSPRVGTREAEPVSRPARRVRTPLGFRWIIEGVQH